MSVLLAAAAASMLVQPVCSWDRPGVDRFRGAPAAALEHYRDIPAADRAALARRIAAGIPDDEVAIGPDTIEGHYRYENAIGDMHFGSRRMCRTVTRTKWAPDHREPAQVYCVNGECVLIPRVCGNVSRVRRTTPGAGAPGVPAAVRPPVQAAPPLAAQPVYPAAPSRPEAPPSWVGPGAPPAVIPPLDYPGPGREISVPLPLPVSPVPEPSQWAMLAAGLLAAMWRGRRK